jgi:aryl-alcohol dehydrogenase-like predicted oxidoreductase
MTRPFDPRRACHAGRRSRAGGQDPAARASRQRDHFRALQGRRGFLSGLAVGAGALGCSSFPDGSTGEVPRLPLYTGAPLNKQSTDRVVLGNTQIEVSRLAMGSGTRGYGGSSDQTRLGLEGFSALLVESYDRGITFWETADQYGAHAHLKRAIAAVGRQNVVILTKTHARTEAELGSDLERFLAELGIDYIDIVLLHNRQSATWTDECAGAMSALSDAKQRGVIRAHGVSCHTLAALQLAARTPWVDVDLARINPAGVEMDADPATVVSVLREMKSAGKGVIGMKILGQGALGDQLDAAIGHAVALDCIDGFTIGFRSRHELEEVQAKIAAV